MGGDKPKRAWGRCQLYRCGRGASPGCVGQKLYSLIFEVREDDEGEFYHRVTLWKATREEEQLYEENS